MVFLDLHPDTQVMLVVVFFIDHEVAMHEELDYLQVLDLLADFDVLVGDWCAYLVLELVSHNKLS